MHNHNLLFENPLPMTDVLFRLKSLLGLYSGGKCFRIHF